MKITFDIQFTPEELSTFRDSIKSVLDKLVSIPKLQESYTVEEAAVKLHLGKTKVYELIHGDFLKADKTGKRYVIPESSLIQFQRNQVKKRYKGS